MAEFDQAPLQIRKVVLTVRDLDRVGGFYRDVIGLAELARDAESAILGAGDTELVELRRDGQARIRSPRDAGLFHTAFLLPTRADLGRWLRRAAEKDVPVQGASDHVVSEAIYLADPEGNGVEIYADRPASAWAWGPDGTLAMRTDPLDAQDLLRSAGTEPWGGAPDGTTIGHVHLQVGATEPADAFYGGILGLDLTTRYPGASFYSSGGYHHHLAANVWNSRNAGPRADASTGLADLVIGVGEPERIAAAAVRAQKAGIATERVADGLSLRDPWNISITLRAAA